MAHGTRAARERRPPPRLGPRASGAPPARLRRASEARAGAARDSNGRAKTLWWVVVALAPNYRRLAPQNLGEYGLITTAE